MGELTAKEFATNFKGKEVPGVLAALLKFQEQYGTETYSACFYLDNNGDGGIESWSEDPAFLAKLFPFATANGSGSMYVLWDNGAPSDSMPVLVFGDEGGVHVVARNALELLQLLAYDTEISVDFDEAYFYKSEDDENESEYAEEYKDWLRNSFGVEPAEEPDVIIQAAQEKYKESFDEWFGQYYEN
jgi:hypothetical protein